MNIVFIKYQLISLFILFLSCGNNDNPSGDVNENPEERLPDPVSYFIVKSTQKANEFELSWGNPSNITSVEISYIMQGGDENDAKKVNVSIFNELKSTYLLLVPEYGTYLFSIVTISKDGKRSDKTTITSTPEKEDVPPAYDIIESNLPIADPHVLYYNERYYAYGTRLDGFEVYISEDLKHWIRNDNLALHPNNSWGTKWFWAPEVYYIPAKNRFYMFYSVEEHINVATSTSPVGPFVQEIKKPIVSDEKAIDTSLFIDEDGTPYLYYVRFTAGNVIWVAEMTDDLHNIKTETLTRCISATEPWERIQATVAEGPSVFKKGDTYYMLYSANHFESKDYAVGYATSDSPLGPWQKYSGNPILKRDMAAAEGLVGTGHGAHFKVEDGGYKYIYHAHASTNSVQPRTSYINDLEISEDGVLSITGKPIRPVVARIR